MLFTVTSFGMLVVHTMAPIGGGLLFQEAGAVSGPKRALAEFAIAGGGDVVAAPVRIGPSHWQFMIDTGSAYSVVDSALRQHVGRLRQTTRSKTSSTVISFFDLPGDAGLGALRFPNGSAAALLDLQEMRKATGHPIYGIIGMDFLRRFVMEIDPDDAVLRFYETLPRAPGVATVMHYSHGTPHITAVFGHGNEQDLMLDTGYCSCGSVGLTHNAFTRLAGGPRITVLTRSFQKATVLGDSKASDQVMLFPSMSVGETTAFDIEAHEEGANLVGLAFFERFKTTFDFPNGKLYLSPGHRVSHGDRADRSGMHIWKISDRVLLRSVDDGSPAADALMNEGDELIAVNGIPVSKMTLHNIRLLLRRESSEVTVRIRRSEREFSATFQTTTRAQNTGNRPTGVNSPGHSSGTGPISPKQNK